MGRNSNIKIGQALCVEGNRTEEGYTEIPVQWHMVQLISHGLEDVKLEDQRKRKRYMDKLMGLST